MRRRLTVSILVLVAATLVVTASAASSSSAEPPSPRPSKSWPVRAGPSRPPSRPAPATKAAIRREFNLIEKTGNFDAITVIRLQPDGTIQNVDGSVAVLALGPQHASNLSVNQLLAGEQIDGHLGQTLVYTAVPTPLPFRRPVRAGGGGHPDGPRPDVRPSLFPVGRGYRPCPCRRCRCRPLPPVHPARSRRRRPPPPASPRVTSTPRWQCPPARIPSSLAWPKPINAMGANLVRAREQERQFLLSVSHELRTPLTSIRGYADAVVDGAAHDPAEGRRGHRYRGPDGSNGSSRTCSTWPVSTPTASHSTSMRSTPPPWPGRWPTGSGPRAAELGIDLSMSIPGRRVGLRRPRPPGPGAGQPLGECFRLRPHPHRGGRRSWSTACRWPGSPTTDRASPADQLDKVFERHFVSDRLQGRRKGSGLGLAIVAELAMAMGGGVRAQSPVVARRRHPHAGPPAIGTPPQLCPGSSTVSSGDQPPPAIARHPR